jgi:cytochrome P450
MFVATTRTKPTSIPRSKATAPGPRGSLLMGTLDEYKNDPIAMLLRLHRQYGDVARNRLGPYITHALAHPSHVKHVLQDNNPNYVRGRFYENFKQFFGDGLLTTDGDFWLRHRRIAQPLFHRKRIDSFSAPVAESVRRLIDRWARYARSGEDFDIVPETMWLTLSVLGKVIFNVDISDTAERVGPAVRLGLEAMMPQGNVNDFIPGWVPTPHNRRIHRAKRALDTIMGEIIEDHRRRRAETSDLITLLLSATNDTTGEMLTPQEVHDEVMTVFLAGHETTASGLSWALFELSRHPDAMHAMRAELQHVLRDRDPSAEDLPRLPFVRMVVDESLRLHPPIWGFTRDALKDDEIGGYHIPAGTSIFLSPYVTHRHRGFWTNPEAFDPARFAPSDNAHDRPRYAYFPYGGGPRQCIGLHLANLQLCIAIAMIGRRFDLATTPGHPIAHGALVSLRPLHGISMTVRPVSAASPEPVDARMAIADSTANPEASPGRAGCPYSGAAIA